MIYIHKAHRYFSFVKHGGFIVFLCHSQPFKIYGLARPVNATVRKQKTGIEVVILSLVIFGINIKIFKIGSFIFSVDLDVYIAPPFTA